MNFSYEQLLAFVAVYEQKAFSKAAIKLNKHRTTISQLINNLEDQVAVALFNRVGRAVESTEDADLLYHYAKQALDQAKAFDRVALSLSYGELESVNIAYCSFLPHKALSGLRRQLIEDFPSMRVNLLVRTKPEIKEGIQDGTIHCGIVNVYESEIMKSIDYTFLGNISFVPFAHVDSKIANSASNRTYSLMKVSREFVIKSLIDDDMTSKVVLSPQYEVIDQLALVVNLVEQGMGWSLLPRAIKDSEYLTDNLVEIKCDQLRQDLKVPMALWCAHSKQITPVKNSIIKSVDDFIAKLPKR